jgi:hypothetical protein
MKKNLGIFIKINTFGVIPLIMIISYIIGYGIYGLVSTDYTISTSYYDSMPPWNVMLFNVKFAPLMGILGGGYYLHNITLPIMKNAKYPEKNARNLFIGYLLVFISYCISGTFGLFGFKGEYFYKDNPEYKF